MANSVALGAVLCLTGYPIEPLLSVLKDEFSRKGNDVVSRNQACARGGVFEYARQNFKKTCPCAHRLKSPEPQLFMSGAEAVRAQRYPVRAPILRRLSDEPVHPDTGISRHEVRSTKIMVRQTEDDEISANQHGARRILGRLPADDRLGRRRVQPDG